MGRTEEEGTGAQGGKAEPFLPGAAWIYLDDESVQLTADLLHLVRPGIQTRASAAPHKRQPSAISPQSFGFKCFNSTCQHSRYVQESPPNVFQPSLRSIKDGTGVFNNWKYITFINASEF